MAVTESTEKEVCQLSLNIGTSASGTIQTSKINLGSLNPNKWDAAKAFACAEDIGACLSKSLYEVLHVRTSVMTE